MRKILLYIKQFCVVGVRNWDNVVRGGDEMIDEIVVCQVGIGNMRFWVFIFRYYSYGRYFLLIIIRFFIEFIWSFRFFFNITFQVERIKFIRVSVLIEIYLLILVLGLECYKIKFGYYLIGNRKSMIVFEGEDG